MERKATVEGDCLFNIFYYWWVSVFVLYVCIRFELYGVNVSSHKSKCTIQNTGKRMEDVNKK